MASTFRPNFSIPFESPALQASYNMYLRLVLAAVGSIGILILSETKLLAAPENFNPGLQPPPPKPKLKPPENTTPSTQLAKH